MYRANIDVSDLSALLQRTRGCVRLVTERADDEFIVRRLIFEVSPTARRQSAQRWDYGNVVLLGGPCTGRQLCQWIASPAEYLGFTFRMPSLHQQVQTEEHASHSPATYAPLPWPFAEYELSASYPTGPNPTDLQHSGYLIGRETTPSFVSIGFATNQFLFGVPEERDTGRRLLIRIARGDAWIRHVHLTPTSLTVRLAGRTVVGSRLELLANSEAHQSVGVDAARRVQFALPQGLPPGGRLLLSRDGVWRDDRYLDLAFRIGQPDFTWDSGDPSTEVEALIAAGEGTNLEFKQEVPTNPEARRSAMKTVAAFANGEGGVILFGVNDEGMPIGVSDPGRLRDAVSTLVHDAVVPVPDYEARVVPAAQKLLVLLRVKSGQEVPYALRDGRYYVRRGGTTFPAEPHELRAIVLGHQRSPSPFSIRFPGT